MANDIEQIYKHLQTDAHIRALIKNKQAKLKQLRLTYYKHLLILYF